MSSSREHSSRRRGWSPRPAASSTGWSAASICTAMSTSTACRVEPRLPRRARHHRTRPDATFESFPSDYAHLRARRLRRSHLSSHRQSSRSPAASATANMAARWTPSLASTPRISSMRCSAFPGPLAITPDAGLDHPLSFRGKGVVEGEPHLRAVPRPHHLRHRVDRLSHAGL